MENPGIAPLDPLTLVGQIRLNLGDTDYVALATPVAGFGSYNRFSDAKLLALLVTGRDSIARATGLAYRQMAGELALTAVNVKTDDLAVDTSKRVSLLLEVAQGWFDTAADEDLLTNDIFEVTPTGARRSAFTDPLSVYTSSPRQDPANPGYYLV